MKTLHLVKVDPALRVNALRAVKHALQAAGLEPGAAYREAEQAVYRVLRDGKPVGLIGPENAEKVVQAAWDAFHAALNHHDAADAAQLAADLEVDAGDEPEPEPGVPLKGDAVEAAFMAGVPENFAPSGPARRAAVVLLMMNGGNVQASWVYAKSLARATGDLDLWLDVANILIDGVGAKVG